MTRKEVVLLLFVYPNLAKMMTARGLGYRDIADILGISRHAAYRRMRGFAAWKLHEIVSLCEYFDISDATWLFNRQDTISQNS